MTIVSNLEDREGFEALRRQYGKARKVYAYGPYREVEVHVFEDAALYYNTVTGKQALYTGADKDAAFGEARYQSERYNVLNKRFDSKY